MRGTSNVEQTNLMNLNDFHSLSYSDQLCADTKLFKPKPLTRLVIGKATASNDINDLSYL